MIVPAEDDAACGRTARGCGRTTAVLPVDDLVASRAGGVLVQVVHSHPEGEGVLPQGDLGLPQDDGDLRRDDHDLPQDGAALRQVEGVPWRGGRTPEVGA